MNAVVMMFFGAGMGMGLLLLVQALRPQSQPIHEVFASVATEGRGYTETARDRSQRSFRDTVGSVGSTLAIASSDEAQLRKDLAGDCFDNGAAWFGQGLGSCIRVARCLCHMATARSAGPRAPPGCRHSGSRRSGTCCLCRP